MLIDFPALLVSLYNEEYDGKPVKVHVTYPQETSGESLNEIFCDAEWESDLETLRLFA